MEILGLEEIIGATKGRIIKKGTVDKFDKLTTDSRKVEKDSIFFALKGENFNGNLFTESALKAGAGLCIVDEEVEAKVSSEGNILLVGDTRKALLDLAEYYRSKLQVKIIGITGSTGKTSTKDIVAAALSSKYKVFKTKGNFNNEIGVPLMIFEIDNSYHVGVLEMGMSNFGEIHNLAKAARPDIAVITNIGISHIENLGSQEGILKAKMEITDFFEKDNLLIVNGDDDFLKKIKDTHFKLIKCGIYNTADIKAENVDLKEEEVSFSVINKNDSMKFSINAPGEHNILNGLLSIACSIELGLSFKEIENGLRNLDRTSMRLEFIRSNGITVINDCYNASPQSMKAALKVQGNIESGRKIAVLGTMLELGNVSYQAHKDVGEYARASGVHELLVTGEYKDAYKEGYGESIRTFESKEDLIKFLKSFVKSGDCILVKASRGMKFEDIVHSINN